MKATTSARGQTSVGDLTRDLFEAAAAVRAVGEQLARTAGQSVARWQVLYMLDAQALTVPAIARRLGLVRQSVQRVADELVDGELVRFAANPDHARSPLLSLTDSGADALARINKQAATWHRQVLRALPPVEIAHAQRLLRILTDVARDAIDSSAGDAAERPARRPR
jgi:DNA-binding MarR family transcriptional regulator